MDFIKLINDLADFFLKLIRKELHLDSDFPSSIESEPDFLFDVRAGRTNFPSQPVNYYRNPRNQENDGEPMVISDTEIGLIN